MLPSISHSSANYAKTGPKTRVAAPALSAPDESSLPLILIASLGLNVAFLPGLLQQE